MENIVHEQDEEIHDQNNQLLMLYEQAFDSEFMEHDQDVIMEHDQDVNIGIFLSLLFPCYYCMCMHVIYFV